MIPIVLAFWISVANDFSFPAAPPPPSAACLRDVSSMLKRKQPLLPERELDPLTECLLEVGDKAIPVLERSLAKGSTDIAINNAIHGLATVGGTRAVSDLRDFYRSHPSNFAKSILCFAMASTGNTDDRQFLIDSLKDDHSERVQDSQAAAAYSLGILRADEAGPALKRNAETGTEYPTFASVSAQQALRWINEKPQAIDFSTRPGPDDDLVSAIVANGLPRLEKELTYFEPERLRVWKHGAAKNWIVRHAKNRPSRMPTLTFHAYRSSDGERAIVSVMVFFDGKNSEGFDIFLERHGFWKVRGIRETWIS